ncbi:MAG: serine hydroxymethyltransferase [Pseudomonadota bacterium]|nr:serine hydroxymethyltransferase [Pseudomonadota bacterium]
MSEQSIIDLLSVADHEVANAIREERRRQDSTIQLIASENFTSPAVLAAQGSILTNKYAEGYPGKRYYGGCEDVDTIETLAINRLKTLFQADYANVQPHSGSSANIAVFSALLKPGDTILGMDLNAGGHLTHGHPVNFSGKIYHAVHYGVDQKGFIDYEEVAALAKKHQPKLIIAGFSAYSQVLDWEAFANIAKSVDAYFLADMAHVSGLVAAGVYPSPVPHADVVTSTTHKTLRGPRGGIILAKDSPLTQRFDKGIFPGTQGGPLMHVIAGKAVCFQQAMSDAFKDYQKQVVLNARAMAGAIQSQGFTIVSGLPHCHMFLVSLEDKDLSGDEAQRYLEAAGIIVNKNTVPNDPRPPMQTSGIRIGTSAMTTRGLDLVGAEKIADWIVTVLSNPSQDIIERVRSEVEVYMASLAKVPNILGE